MMHIGFTGTRNGMTTPQSFQLGVVLRELAEPWTAHHGDCVGADAEFHDAMRVFGARIEIHPGPISEHTAGCVGDYRHEPLPHMQRNRAIVAAADVMIATPAEMQPQKRGGTWATIGFTRRAAKPLAIVWPDGTVTKERWPT